MKKLIIVTILFLLSCCSKKLPSSNFYFKSPILLVDLDLKSYGRNDFRGMLEVTNISKNKIFFQIEKGNIQIRCSDNFYAIYPKKHYLDFKISDKIGYYAVEPRSSIEIAVIAMAEIGNDCNKELLIKDDSYIKVDFDATGEDFISLDSLKKLTK